MDIALSDFTHCESGSPPGQGDESMYDLLLKQARVIDPQENQDEVRDIAFRDGNVAAIEKSIPASEAIESHDLSGRLIVPGLIDLHTHVYWGGAAIGIEPDGYAKASGLSTLVDAGTAGPGNFTGFLKHVIEPAETRILAFLNLSFPGIFAFSKEVMVGECGDLRLLNPAACLKIASLYPDDIVGIKVRVGLTASAGRGVAPLDIALEVADELGLPVMCHLDNPPPSRLEVVSRLRKGDILTHCFRPFPNAPARMRDGAVREEIIAARERGVIFDIGHGQGSFGFVTAEAMIAADFLPECISSDVHVLSIDGSAQSQLNTMSKFLALGGSLNDVIAASTSGPASAIGRPSLGSLLPGTPGDATVLNFDQGDFEFTDVQGLVRTGNSRLTCEARVLSGRWHSA